MSLPKKWEKKIEEGDAQCYIKPTMRTHDSGYRCFEVGYCVVKNARVVDKLVLGNGSDHIWYNSLFKTSRQLDINMDLTLDGYIRIFSHSGTFRWEHDVALSSATLEGKHNT